MSNFQQIAAGLDTEPLRQALVRQPELFGRHRERTQDPSSPHHGSVDLWLRFRDHRDKAKCSSWAEFAGPHEPIWYEEAAMLPEVRRVVFDVMRIVEAEKLGGILITKIPPGGRIERHVDRGWHAEHYEKIYVAIQSPEGSKFCFEDGEIRAANGEAWWFRNDVPHWVENDTDQDRIAMIICLGFHGIIQ